MSKRNIVWLVAIVVVGVFVGIVAGWLWGLLAAAIVLVVSEVVERSARRRRRADRGETGPTSLAATIESRRRRR
ncbi:MAG: hypothetical protein CL424_03525 [Acidimicrobiaceae bacterium]|nr:hypothetical protein [Acidimicrobiaceae bacterium]